MERPEPTIQRAALPPSRRSLSVSSSSASDALGRVTRDLEQRTGRTLHARLPPPSCERCVNGWRRATVEFRAAPCECARGQYEAARERRLAEEEAETLRRNRAEAIVRALRLPTRAEGWTLEGSPMETRTWQQLVDWLRAWDWRRGLLLLGPTGVGKTGWLVGALKSLRERAVDEGWTMRFVATPQLFRELRQGYDDGTAAQVFDRYASTHLLALDDLGAERPTGWTLETWFDLLNARYEAARPTWATSNLAGEGALIETLGERVAWRLLETSDVFTIAGANERAR